MKIRKIATSYTLPLETKIKLEALAKQAESYSTSVYLGELIEARFRCEIKKLSQYLNLLFPGYKMIERTENKAIFECDGKGHVIYYKNSPFLEIFKLEDKEV